MNIKPGLKYSKEHEWIRVDGSQAVIGITDFAQQHLGEIVFAELPEVGADLTAGDTLGTLESVKAATDVYTQVSGQVTAINEELLDNPGAINKTPYDSWLAVLEMSDPGELDGLMDEAAYGQFCAEEEH